MEGQNIICFAKDFSEDPTSNNHVMRLLARRNKVLWINSIATRTPSLSRRRDLQKIWRKVRAFAHGPIEVEANLWVWTPLVLPFPHSNAAAMINRRLLQAAVGWLRSRLGIDHFQLWSFLPTAVRHVGLPGERLVVYYCTDEWSRFSFVDGARIADMDRAMCVRADVVFATARSLYERRRALNPETHLALHGVDHDHFARALDESTPVAPELAECRGPIIGFIGLVHDWIDQPLLAHVAQRRPGWTIALIGQANIDTSALARLPNVKLLGRRPYAELPPHLKAFSVGTIPFVLNELTESVNPIKLREYLSAGLPVVSTDLPEVRPFADRCLIARSGDGFIAACERAMRDDGPEARRRRSDAMAGETWEAKVEQVGHIVERALQRREGTRGLRALAPADAAGAAR